MAHNGFRKFRKQNREKLYLVDLIYFYDYGMPVVRRGYLKGFHRQELAAEAMRWVEVKRKAADDHLRIFCVPECVELSECPCAPNLENAEDIHAFLKAYDEQAIVALDPGLTYLEEQMAGFILKTEPYG